MTETLREPLQPGRETTQHTNAEPLQKHWLGHLPAQEINGPKGLEPTRYGDWEKNGRCIDF
jgi:hypothetical protein